MAYNAHLAALLGCPNCNNLITDMVWFQWGYCDSYNPNPKYMYQLGDPIYWRSCSDGTTPDWTYFEHSGGNMGDPGVKNLIVRDHAQRWLTAPCNSCGYLIGGAAIKIVDGFIQRAWLYSPGELDSSINIYILEDNQVIPIPDWNDHSMYTRCC